VTAVTQCDSYNSAFNRVGLTTQKRKNDKKSVPKQAADRFPQRNTTELFRIFTVPKTHQLFQLFYLSRVHFLRYFLNDCTYSGNPVQSHGMDLETDKEGSFGGPFPYITELAGTGYLVWMGILRLNRLALDGEREIGRKKSSCFIHQILR
jgi:hypothetical protein